MKDYFEINKPLDKNTYRFLKNFVDSYRIPNFSAASRFGIEGEFCTRDNYVEGNITPRPPSTQPTNLCPFSISSEAKQRIFLENISTEHVWAADQWIEYLISKVFAPRGYVLNGKITVYKVNYSPLGVATETKEIVVKNNEVNGKRLIVDYSINNLLGKHIPQTGLRSDGTKTKHQIQKEKQDAKIKNLEEKIAELERKLAGKSKRLEVKDILLEAIKNESGYDLPLPEFKKMLRDLLDD